MAKLSPTRGAIPRNRTELKKLRRAVWLRMIELEIGTLSKLAEHLELKLWTLSKTLLGRRGNPEVLRVLVRFAYGEKEALPPRAA